VGNSTLVQSTDETAPRNTSRSTEDDKHTVSTSLKRGSFAGRQVSDDSLSVSGVPSEAEGFLQGLPISSWPHGESQPRKDIKLIYTDGYSIVIRDRLIKRLL